MSFCIAITLGLSSRGLSCLQIHLAIDLLKGKKNGFYVN